MNRALALVLAACGTAPPAPAPTVTSWRVPAGWKQETIPFPLGFAPSLAHRGVEELRFPPGFLDEASPNRWSYVFVWRLEDAATLDATQLGDELTTYFRGLLVAVDGDKKRIDPMQVTANASVHGSGFALRAHVIDTFKSAGPVDLVGTARRVACSRGAMWVVVLAPEASPIRSDLEALGAEASCTQTPVPTGDSP